MNTGQIVKSKSTERFTTVPNEIIKGKDLTLEEKGLLCFLLSLPSDWVLYRKNLYDSLPDSPGTIDRVFSSLRSKNYILSVRVVNEKGQFVGWNHVVYDSPAEEKPKSVNAGIGLNGNPTLPFAEVGESAPILKTDINTNTKEETKDRKAGQAPVSPEEVIDKKKRQFFNEVIAWVKANPGKYPKQLIFDFAKYWTEPNLKTKKIRRCGETYFDLSGRLATFFKRSSDAELSKMWEAEKLTDTLNKQLQTLLKN